MDGIELVNAQLYIHRNEDQRKDSIEIGTAGKGGALKVYFNADAPLDDTKALIENAKKALDYARELMGVQ